jgi:hypothetical protein
VTVGTVTANSVSTTTSADNTDVAGVVVTGGANNAQICVASEGRWEAKATGSVAIGDWLSTSTTAKAAGSLGGAPAPGCFAQALASKSTGVGLVYVWSC